MLPKQFIPVHNYDLIRIGSKGDGGYLVEKQSLKNSKMVMGLGLNDNWCFEKEVIAKYKIPVVGFDNMLSTKYLVQLVIPKFFALRKFYKAERFCDFAKGVYRIFDYQKYRTLFHQKFIGYPLGSGYLSLTQLFEQYVKETPVFLKCDIEGWEYRILDELINCSNLLSGLAIEFHDIDLHRVRIASFIEKFPLTLVHTHPNNYGGVDGNRDPLTIEMTFSKGAMPIDNKPCRLPHKLDSPNRNGYPDLKIAF